VSDPIADIGRAYATHVTEYEAANPDRSFAEPMLRWLVEGLTPGARVIDLGCGPGWEVRRLGELGFSALGLDVTVPFLGRARSLDLSWGYLAGDFRALPVRDESCDGAFSSSSYVHVSWADIDDALGEVARILRPGGLFVASVQAGSSEGPVSSRSVPGMLLHYAYYEPDEWRRRLEAAGMVVEELRYHASAPEHCNPGAHGWIETLARRG
jgi:ubiquinone/menaquinone biosynthesis C-methylase UbiE